MAYLIASIFFSSLLGFIFKLFGKYGVHQLAAIVTNYFVCFLLGRIIFGQVPLFDIPSQEWFPYAVLLGSIFIVGFNCLAATVRYFGITITTLMQRISLVLTVLFALLMFKESAGWIKMSGILLAFVSIFLINHQKKSQDDKRYSWLILALPILTFITSGFIDSFLLYVQRTGIALGTDVDFITTVFLSAGVIGATYSLLSRQASEIIKQKNILWGILLGTPNFFSMYFIMRLLDLNWEGSVVFPLNNIGIMAFSTLGAVFLFKERLSVVQIFGLILAALAMGILGFMA